MPTLIQNRTFSNNACVLFPEKAELVSVRLPGGVNYPQNTILGETNLPKQSEIQTLTFTTATGTFTLALDGIVSAAIPVTGVTAAIVQTAVDSIIGVKNCVVAGTVTTGSGAFTLTYAGEYASHDVVLVTVALVGTGTVVPTETLRGSPGQGMMARQYLLGATDGSQTAKFILKNAVQTDAKGALLNEYGVPSISFTTSAYASAIIRAAEIPGLTLANLAQLGRLYSGNLITDQGALVKIGL